MKYLTTNGHNKIKEELAYLNKIKRVELKEQLKFATELGDLRENSEYDAVCEDYIQTENRIFTLEKLLNESIIYTRKYNNKIEIGSKVKLLIDNEIEEYEIVGYNESDLFNNKISYDSPLGKSLINKRIDDTVKVETTNSYNVKVIEIN